MSRDLRLRLVLDTIERASAPLRRITQASTRTSRALRASRDQLKQLQAQQRKLKSFERLQTATRKSADELATAQRKAADLARQFHATANPSQKLTRQFNKARAAAKRLKDAHSENQAQLHGLNRELQESGVNTQNVGRQQELYRRRIEQTNREIERQRQQLEQLARLQRQRQAVSAAGAEVRSKAGSLALQGTAAATAGGYFFKTQFLDKAAQFEDFQATLKTVEGSSKKAQKAMAWVSDFAAKTPYELDQVTEAYVTLRSYGLEPTNGLLKTLGDTSSAMNKPILQSVEAIADAVTGENERLKEFGIKASKAGGLITYEYTNAKGQQQTASAADDNRAEIQKTLAAIWNEKYGGAMDERSRTWNGMVSNMSDQWTRFATMVMDAGLFDWMKGKLGNLLTTLNQMAADGSLQALAQQWGTTLMSFARGTWAIISAVSSATNSIAELVGGWDNLIYIMVAAKVAPLVTSIGKLGWELAKLARLAAVRAGLAAIFPYFGLLGSSILSMASVAIPALLGALKAVSLFLLTNPIGLAITAIAGAAALIYYNWEPIADFFSGLWGEVKTAFEGGFSGVLALLANWSPMALLYKAIRSGLAMLGIELPAKFTDFGGMLIDGLINGLTAKWDALKSSISGIAESVSGWFKDTLGIRSPSRVFISHGSDVMAGLEQGLQDNNSTLKPVQEVSQKLTRAGAAMALPTPATQPAIQQAQQQLEPTRQVQQALPAQQPMTAPLTTTALYSPVQQPVAPVQHNLQAITTAAPITRNITTQAPAIPPAIQQARQQLEPTRQVQQALQQPAVAQPTTAPLYAPVQQPTAPAQQRLQVITTAAPITRNITTQAPATPPAIQQARQQLEPTRQVQQALQQPAVAQPTTAPLYAPVQQPTAPAQQRLQVITTAAPITRNITTQAPATPPAIQQARQQLEPTRQVQQALQQPAVAQPTTAPLYTPVQQPIAPAQQRLQVITTAAPTTRNITASTAAASPAAQPAIQQAQQQLEPIQRARPVPQHQAPQPATAQQLHRVQHTTAHEQRIQKTQLPAAAAAPPAPAPALQWLQPLQQLLAPLKAISTQLIAAGTSVAIASPALSAPPILDNRPPLQSASPAPAAAPSLHIGEIHIHAAPGMDEQALAQRVIAEIERREQLHVAGLRSSLRDDD